MARHTIATAAAATGSSDLAAAEAAALCVCVLATSSSGSSTAAAAQQQRRQRVREDWSQQCDSFRGTTPRVTPATPPAGDTPPRLPLQLITHLVPWPVMRPGGVSGARNTPDTPTTAPCKLDTDTDDPPSADRRYRPVRTPRMATTAAATATEAGGGDSPRGESGRHMQRRVPAWRVCWGWQRWCLWSGRWRMIRSSVVRDGQPA